MTHFFSVDGATVHAHMRTTMAAEGLREVDHLEKWIASHPEVLGADVMIVATQFDRWHSTAGDRASERLDVLALDSQGRSVVVELKRGSDKRVHLQALTYAALVARFTPAELGSAHAEYLTSQGSPTASSEGLRILEEHLDTSWDSKVLARPRVVLIAERFPSQVLTTVPG